MALLLITLTLLAGIKAIPRDVIITMPYGNDIAFVDGDANNPWYKIKVLGSTISRHIYVAVFNDGDDSHKDIYAASIAAIGDSIKGCIGITSTLGDSAATDYFFTNYPTLKGVIQTNSWQPEENMKAYCNNLINTRNLELCFLNFNDVAYDPSDTYVSYFLYTYYDEVITLSGDTSIDAGKWAKTFIVLELGETDYNTLAALFPSSLAYIYSADEDEFPSSYIESLVQLVKTSYTCHPWCTGCNDEGADYCLDSCQHGFKLTGTTCACNEENKALVGSGESATCNCTGSLVNLNGVCTACNGQTMPNIEDNGCTCWDASEPTGEDSNQCPSCPGQTKLSDDHDRCECWDGSVATGVDSKVCPSCPGQTKLNDAHLCDCWDDSDPTGADSGVCPFMPRRHFFE
jgi:hypothetical protein